MHYCNSLAVYSKNKLLEWIGGQTTQYLPDVQPNACLF